MTATHPTRPHMTWLIMLTTILVFALGNPESLILYPIGSAKFHTWQLVTYMLPHGNWLHLAVNVVALVCFGPPLERAWGKGRFLTGYLVCAIFGGLIQAAVASAPTMGASGALFGLFAAWVIDNPKRQVISLIPVPMPAWAVLVIYIGLSALAWALHWAVGVAHAAHVGGAAMGVLFYFAVGKR